MDNYRNHLLKINVLATAIDFIAQNGFENTTISKIAEKVDLSKGSLYKLVGSKENLIYLIADFVTEKYKKVIENLDIGNDKLNSKTILTKYISAHIDIVDEMQDAFISIGHMDVKFPKEGRNRLINEAFKISNDIERIPKRGVQTRDFKIANTTCE